MRKSFIAAAILSTPLLASASCSATDAGDSPSQAASTGSATGSGGGSVGEAVGDIGPFAVASLGEFDQPWALAMEPGTGRIFITERPGTMKWVNPSTGRLGSVESGLPEVDYGGQGGLGDFKFAPDYEQSGTVYLTWAEAGDGDTRGAAMGRGTLVCEEADSCRLDGFEVIWRQAPKVTGRGHYSHRIAFSPDGQYLFLSSGDRQKQDPAQDLSNNLGTVLRLNLDGTPAAGNPFWDRGGVSREIWSYGHRNLLGLKFNAEGELWDLEHGPRGGDELNRVQRGLNYGWPVVSDGVNYNGSPIPDHDTRPEFEAPAISWTPVIAPGDFIFYNGAMWPEWQGEAIIANLGTQSIVRVAIDGNDDGTEVARYAFGNRLRDIMEDPDGSLWVIEDGAGGRLLHLTAN